MLYHGTVEAYLPEISKRGVLPNWAHRWQVISAIQGHNIGREDHGGSRLPAVYVTTKRETAENFARAKAHYLAVKPGAHFITEFGMFTKAADAPAIYTRVSRQPTSRCTIFRPSCIPTTAEVAGPPAPSARSWLKLTRGKTC